jgi:hypothetical protein
MRCSSPCYPAFQKLFLAGRFKMDTCVACGSRVEDGLTKCPQCGATLSRPGAFLQVIGWVVTFASSIPLVVGVITVEQGEYTALAVGIGVFLAGTIMIVLGRIQIQRSPPTTKPLPKTEIPQPSIGEQRSK